MSELNDNSTNYFVFLKLRGRLGVLHRGHCPHVLNRTILEPWLGPYGSREQAEEVARGQLTYLVRPCGICGA